MIRRGPHPVPETERTPPPRSVVIIPLFPSVARFFPRIAELFVKDASGVRPAHEDAVNTEEDTRCPPDV